jgi:uncharacterized membrane protein YidH (DUF202 family)
MLLNIAIRALRISVIKICHITHSLFHLFFCFSIAIVMVGCLSYQRLAAKVKVYFQRPAMHTTIIYATFILLFKTMLNDM